MLLGSLCRKLCAAFFYFVETSNEEGFFEICGDFSVLGYALLMFCVCCSSCSDLFDDEEARVRVLF